MKKWLTLTTILMMFFAVAYAMDPLEDETLAGIDGQAGLSLTAYGSAASISYSLYGLSWGDDDGDSHWTAADGAGHLAIRGASANGAAQVALTIAISIPSTGPVTMDVDSTGIFLGMPGLNYTVTSPPRMQFSANSGVVSSFAGVLEADTTKVGGDLALDELSITVSMPNNLRISPH